MVNAKEMAKERRAGRNDEATKSGRPAHFVLGAGSTEERSRKETAMQTKCAAVLAFVSGLTAVSASAATGSGDTSWGKPGVSLQAYSADAAACVQEAVDLDISNTRPAQMLVAATRQLQHVVLWGPMSYSWPGFGNVGVGGGIPAGNYREVRDMFRPDRQFAAIKAMQQQMLDDCLVQRGYRQFRLTEDQQSRLRRLTEGSNERRTYLHSLAADPSVLRRQGLDGSSLTPPQG